ncbi:MULTISPECIES: MFS transporter [Gordonia]|uniref:MFS transporter n=1 Tax=Gordonia TaxID=2053 RepID=UPI00258034D2|nr:MULTISPECIES: MFS transporter [Gordonia]
MKNSTAFLVAGCFFMEMLDATIVTTAAPEIGAALHEPATAVAIVITSYMLALAAFIPIGGWLITRLPARSVLVGAIATFTVASLLCGLAQSLEWLVVARVLQGVGGAMMVPVGRQVVLRDAAKTDVMRLMSYIIWPGLLAPVIAPLVGALIAGHLGWQWIFWINVPLGVVAALVALRVTPTTVDGPPRRLDIPGVVLVGASLGAVVWTAHLIADTDSAAAVVISWLVASVVLLVAALVHLLRAKEPIVELHVLRDRVFGASQFGMGVFFMVVSAVPFLMPLMLQTAFGWSPVRAGVLVMFVFVGNIGIKPVAKPLIERFGFRRILGVSTIGLAATAVALGLCTAATSPVIIALIALLSGVFRSTALTAYSTIGFATIEVSQRRAANTLSAVNQQLATGLGVAIAAVGVRFGAVLSGDPQSHVAYAWAFGVVAAVTLLSALAVVLLPGDAGRELHASRA